MKKSADKIVIRSLNQIGIVVKNLEEVMDDYWNILGIGPWTVFVLKPPYSFDMTCGGIPCSYTLKVGLAKVGSIELKLIESIEGPTTYIDFLKQHGEGAYHLQYPVSSVEELDRHVDMLAQQGFSSVWGGRFGYNGGWSHIDTSGKLGTIWGPYKMDDCYEGPVNNYPADTEATNPVKIKVDAIAQISIFVRDIEKTIKNYQDILGIGPWELFDVKPSMLYDVTYRGKPGKYTMKVGLTKLGSIELELIQPTSGRSAYTDFIARHGEGINHLAFAVDCVERTNKLMEEEGFSIIQSGRRYDGRGTDDWSYYDTIDRLKVVWEAWQPPVTK
ncbi:MAG: VOC family protein [Dehalococcoidia bacterium]|nr:MAG: VOC family protein [Dehalococcoidia bacterium]